MTLLTATTFLYSLEIMIVTRSIKETTTVPRNAFMLHVLRHQQQTVRNEGIYGIRIIRAREAREVPRPDIQLLSCRNNAFNSNVRIRNGINLHGVAHFLITWVAANTPTPVRVFRVDMFDAFVDGRAEKVIRCGTYSGIIENVRNFLIKGEGVGEEDAVSYIAQRIAATLTRKHIAALNKIQNLDEKNIVNALRGKIEKNEET